MRVFPDPLAKPLVVGVRQMRHGEMKRLTFDEAVWVLMGELIQMCKDGPN